MTPEGGKQVLRELIQGWGEMGRQKLRNVPVPTLVEDLRGISDFDAVAAAKRIRATSKFVPSNVAAAIRQEVQAAREAGRSQAGRQDQVCPDCDKGWLLLVLEDGSCVASPCTCPEGAARREWARRSLRKDLSASAQTRFDMEQRAREAWAAERQAEEGA